MGRFGSFWVVPRFSNYPMGSYDGAEVCELVGLFILNDICNEYGKHNIGLYRDDGLLSSKISQVLKLNEYGKTSQDASRITD